MYEFQLGNLTQVFINDFDDYISDRKFGIEFISTKLPQMRTIPVAKSIQPQHHVSTFDEVTMLLQQAEAPFAIFECICRKKKALGGDPCQVTNRKETCFATGCMAQAALRHGIGREITREESLSILEENQKQGLVGIGKEQELSMGSNWKIGGRKLLMIDRPARWLRANCPGKGSLLF
jgi:electron transport complex protein RnfB